MMKKGKYYYIVDKENGEAMIVESKDPKGAARTMRSRFGKGFYRGRNSYFGRFQDVYDDDPGKVEVVGTDKGHRVFVENELRERMFRILGDDEIVRSNRGYVTVKVPEKYVDNVKALVGQLQERDGKK